MDAGTSTGEPLASAVLTTFLFLHVHALTNSVHVKANKKIRVFIYVSKLPSPAPKKGSFNYTPLTVKAWEFIEPGTIIRDTIAQPKQFVRVLLDNGQVLLAKRHPTAHSDSGSARLYGAEGEYAAFFSLSSKGFNQIKPNWNQAMENFIGGSIYPVLRQFIADNHTGCLLCHHAMYEIWYGPRDPECHIHHLNGDKFDWCENNLIELKAKIKHPNADARQRLIASAIGDLHQLTHQRLRELTLMPNNEFLHALEQLKINH